MKLRIAIVSDAWRPQVNGVVRTLTMLVGELERMGHTVLVIGPDQFRTLPCPSYPDIRLAVLPRRQLDRILAEFRPSALHIATEGPLGLSAARWARARNLPYTTAFHTRFAEYLHARTRLPVAITYAWLRRFHSRAAGTLVATASLRDELAARGFQRLLLWSRGVDLAGFRPAAREPRPNPIFLSVGRIAVEKNLAAFLDLDLPGEKRVVGDGPMLPALRRAYPHVSFTGKLTGRALAAEYDNADVFVFPSRTDTFGLVLLEALACGTPVAAYPVTGPSDVLAQASEPVGALDEDLRAACLAALHADRGACRRYAEGFSWASCAITFSGALVPFAWQPARTRAPGYTLKRNSSTSPSATV